MYYDVYKKKTQTNKTQVAHVISINDDFILAFYSLKLLFLLLLFPLPVKKKEFILYDSVKQYQTIVRHIGHHLFCILEKLLHMVQIYNSRILYTKFDFKLSRLDQ